MGGEIYRGGKYMLLETMKDNYLEYVKVNLSKGTYQFYSNHLEYMLNYLKKIKIIYSDDLSLDILSNFVVNERKNNVSNATINKRILTLKLIFKHSDIFNEILTFKKLKENKNTFSVLTKEELKQLNEFLNSDLISLQNQLIVLLLIDTGMRLGEIVHVKVSNINFVNNTIYLETTKTKRGRFVLFTNSTALLLKKYIKTLDDDNLFKLTTSGIGSLFCRIKKQLNFNKFHPHMLRHTLCSKLHNDGVSILIIQKIMGHANVATTQRYAHFELDNILNAYHSVME